MQDVCDLVVSEVRLLYEPLWQLPQIRSASHQRIIGGLWHCLQWRCQEEGLETKRKQFKGDTQKYCEIRAMHSDISISLNGMFFTL